MSDAPKTQAVYWRCVVGFFASSLAVNPNARHLLFTNVPVPEIDGLDIARWLSRNGIETVVRPITYRLPPGSVKNWGNQFYVFDILDHLSEHREIHRAVVLDCDCVWLRPADGMVSQIDQHGALTYTMHEEDYARDEVINGLTRGQMARFLEQNGGPSLDAIPYFGGEIYAARSDVTRRIAQRARALWPAVRSQGEDAPREEAHLLSVLYAFEGIAPDTAAPFIRRMWTTFKFNDLASADADLTIWHLPAEKKTGFADLFARIAAAAELTPSTSPVQLGLTLENYARDMGWPQRRPAKLIRDLTLKIAEKFPGR